MTELEEILIGIDKDNAVDDDGYWETSAGVEFGKSVLEKALAYEARLKNEIAELRSVIEDSYGE